MDHNRWPQEPRQVTISFLTHQVTTGHWRGCCFPWHGLCATARNDWSSNKWVDYSESTMFRLQLGHLERSVCCFCGYSQGSTPRSRIYSRQGFASICHCRNPSEFLSFSSVTPFLSKASESLDRCWQGHKLLYPLQSGLDQGTMEGWLLLCPYQQHGHCCARWQEGILMIWYGICLYFQSRPLQSCLCTILVKQVSEDRLYAVFDVKLTPPNTRNGWLGWALLVVCRGTLGRIAAASRRGC